MVYCLFDDFDSGCGDIHMKQIVSSWGGFSREMDAVLIDPCAFKDFINKTPGNFTCYGAGRSYGDVAINENEISLNTRKLNKIISLDLMAQEIECESGVTLDEILKLIVPHGLFLPVSPGTKFITVGGAVANDIHGKNHHKAGSFGHHVISLDLMRSDGVIYQCDRSLNANFFAATIGGVGLTGVILKVKFKLIKVENSYLDVDKIIFKDVDEYMSLNATSSISHDYTVAWFDVSNLLKKNGQLRGVYIRGNHSMVPTFSRKAHPAPIINLPNVFPGNFTGSQFFHILNFLQFYKEKLFSGRMIEHYNSFFYPLDFIGNWNYLYGKSGFFQFQPIVPVDQFSFFLSQISVLLRKYNQTSFISVLKTMGAKIGEGHLSFSRAGITLCLDFKNDGVQTVKMMHELYDLTLICDGVINPSKDAFMKSNHFERLLRVPKDVYESALDPRFNSDFGKRVMQ
jgi:FAD/FMN-containing dehydrogenase